MTNRCAGWDPEWKMQLGVGEWRGKAAGDRRSLEGSQKKAWGVPMKGRIEKGQDAATDESEQ